MFIYCVHSNILKMNLEDKFTENKDGAAKEWNRLMEKEPVDLARVYGLLLYYKLI